MSLSERVGKLRIKSYQIKHTALFEKAHLVEELAAEMIVALMELAERIEKLEGAGNGEN
jgi:hypothetical protein